MRFGLGLWPRQAPAESGRLAAVAEAAGFDAVWVPDERFYRDCYLTLASVAQATRRVRLGPCVTDPYSRHPALTAVAVATLDELAAGRAVLGIGAGVSGFAALGLTRDRPAVAIHEAVALVRRLWSGEAVTQPGRVVRFHGGQLDFPARPIPVFVAGRGPRILEVAGEIADGVIIGALASPPLLAYALGHVARGAARAGRHPDRVETILWLHTALGPDAAAARDAVRPIVVGVLVSSAPVLDRLGIGLPDGLRAELAGLTYTAHSPEVDRVARRVPDDVLAHFTMAGDGAHCRAVTARLAAAGVTQLAIVPWLVPRQTLEHFITAFAREVIAPARTRPGSYAG
jgi:5,10-methylenetetrahydromethanopterin reductase